MADVGEEPALEAVQFDELAVGFLELLAVFVQFVTEGEFAETRFGVEITAGDNDDARQGQKIEIVDKLAQAAAGVEMRVKEAAR